MPRTSKADQLVAEKVRETKIPEAQWRAVYDHLKKAGIGMTAAEKEKVFREAPTPGVVEDWITQLREEVVTKIPKTVGSPKGAHV